MRFRSLIQAIRRGPNDQERKDHDSRTDFSNFLGEVTFFGELTFFGEVTVFF